MEFLKVVALSWLPFKLDVYVSCCEAFVNRGKILPPLHPHPPVTPRNVNFSRSLLVSSFFFPFNRIQWLHCEGCMALCIIVDALKEHKKHWTGSEAEGMGIGGGGSGGL